MRAPSLSLSLIPTLLSLLFATACAGRAAPGSSTPASRQGTAPSFEAAAAIYRSARADGRWYAGECEAATRAFLEVHVHDGEPTALFNAAAIREECGQPDAAIALYERVIAAAPEHAAARNNLARILWRRGETERALTLLRGAPSGALIERTILVVALDDYARRHAPSSFAAAERVIQETLARDGSQTPALESLARLYLERGRSSEPAYLLLAEEVIAYTRRLLAELGRESAELHVITGLVDLARGRQGAALARFDHALQLDAEHAEAHLQSAYLTLGHNDFQRARRHMTAALRHPEVRADAEAWLVMGAILRALGALDEAERAYKRAQRLAPDDPRAHYNLGVLYRARARRSVDAHDSYEGLRHGRVARDHFNRFRELASGSRELQAAADAATVHINAIDDEHTIICEFPRGRPVTNEDELRRQEEAERARLRELERRALEAAAAAERAEARESSGGDRAGS